MLCVPGRTGLDRRFSDNYQQARTRFISAARNRREPCIIGHLEHPLPGRQGERLWLDYAWLGDPQAATLLVLQSATHGIEGHAGSALQTDQLLSGSLPPGIAVLHIHALNPHGFSWGRRVNEDGVDLNRNFVDFDSPLPHNPDFERVRDALLPRTGSDWQEADRRLQQLASELGGPRYERAVSGGQYSDPLGLFYGGVAPTWSRRSLERLFQELKLDQIARVAVLDIHTGLGPFGYGELICDHLPGSVGAKLARQWYGDSVTEPALGTSSSVPKEGLVDYAWQAALGDSVCFVTLEFGTYPFENMMQALRKDHWIHARPLDQRDPAQVSEAANAVRSHFFPQAPDWKEAVIFRGRQVIAQAMAGLAGGSSG